MRKLILTGNKMEDKKYMTPFSGYPGGQKEEVAENLIKTQALK
jgi:ribosomal protein L13